MRQRTRLRAVYVDTVETDVSAGVALLEEAGFDVCRAVATTADELIVAGRRAVALLVGDTPVMREAFDALDELRIVSACMVGVDHVDVDAARARGVWVTNVPDAATEEVAVHALAMALALVRHLPGWDRHVRAGGWDYQAEGTLRRPSSLTLGLVGLGRIGRRLAELARPIFGRLLAADPQVAERDWPPEVERVGLDEVFERSNVVSLHVPLTVETEGLVNRVRLGLMPRGGYLVNVSRGALVERGSLLEALDDGRLAGAGLDVFASEPPDPADPLLHHPNVLLSPHVAFLSDEADRSYVVKQAENVVAWHRTGVPLTPVVEGAA